MAGRYGQWGTYWQPNTLHSVAPVISNAQYAISNMPWRIDKVVYTRDAFDDGEYNKKNVTASAQRGFGSSRPCKSISGAWVRTACVRTTRCSRLNLPRTTDKATWHSMVYTGGTSYQKLGAQKKFAVAPTIPVFPHLLGAHALFWPPVEVMHAVTNDHNESESYRPTIICRHCIDQQTDSLVFTEFQSDHREW